MSFTVRACKRPIIPRKAAIAAALAACALTIAGVALAEEFSSQYTSTAQRNCKKVRASKGDGDWSVRSCPGVAGLMVLLNEDDLRTTVSVGRTPAAAGKEKAAMQGFGPFNFVGDMLEWRSVKGAAQPFATILRWMIADNENLDKNSRPISAPLLVVTRLAPGPVCHVAYIDGRANAEPNKLARQAADENARALDCANKPLVIGERWRAIALALP
jgi:hypothetical protein